MKTITKTAFTRALSLASAHGHMWACHTEHPAVAAIFTGPGPYDAAALTEAFSWAAAEDDSRVGGGIGFALSHTTGTGRLSWVVAGEGQSKGPYDSTPSAGDVDLTISRPSLAWRVWAAQRDTSDRLAHDEPRLSSELARMLPPEPERGSLDVLAVRIPAFGPARWLHSREVGQISSRHLSTLAEAAHAIGGTATLADVYEIVRSMDDEMADFDMFGAAGIVMSQTVYSDGRVVRLDMWGQAHLDIHLHKASIDEPLDYVDTGIWTRGDTRRSFLASLTTTAFLTRIVDRLMSWAGQSLEHACQTMDLALDEVGVEDAKVRPITVADGSWSVEVIRPAPTTGPIFASED